jgi:hypothetical protein
MRRFLLLLVPAALFAGQARYARLGEFEGKVEVQVHAADAWTIAERNLALPESSWLRTGPGSRLEIELDEGSAWRLGPDTQVELSDYSRLSTGQRVTVLSLERGVAYFTGEPEGKDALSLAVPGAQITLLRGARVRLEAQSTWSRISIIEGVVRFSSPSAELDLREGQTVRVEPANTSRFFLDREVASMDLDRWSEERDKALASAVSASHVPHRYGVADLDAAGEWVQTGDLGLVWKPKAPEGWAPFQKGRWRWYDALGYTWVSDETWGWLPYHYGRWTRRETLGWVWAPAAKAVFKPGDVYWLYGAKLAGWGPLAPGEDWTPSAAPQQFLNVNTTYAAFQTDARLIDPAGFTARPREPLGVAVFALALPSPAFPATRLEATRLPLRVGGARVLPVIPGTNFDTSDLAPPPAPPPAVVTNPGTNEPPLVMPGPPPDPGPPGPPMQVVYPVPVYTGVVVINPPEHPDYSRRDRGGNRGGNQGGNGQPSQPTPTPTPAKPTVTPPAPPAAPTHSVPRSVTPPDIRPPSIPRMTPVEHPRPEPRREPESKPAPRAESKPEPKVEAKPAESKPAESKPVGRNDAPASQTRKQ